MVASNILNLSIKNQRFEANVFKMISARKRAKKVVSIFERKVSLIKGIKSAKVSQNMMKIVYNEIKNKETFSKYWLSRAFMSMSLIFGSQFSYLLSSGFIYM